MAGSAHALSSASGNLGAAELAHLSANLVTPSGADLLADKALLDALEFALGPVRSAPASR